MTSMPRALLLPGLIAVVTVAGCEEVPPLPCAVQAAPGIMVQIRDSVTNGGVGAGARVIATEGTFADTAYTGPGLDPVPLVYERAGVYIVTVEQPDYLLWRRTGVSVTRGACGVLTVNVVALLQPD